MRGKRWDGKSYGNSRPGQLTQVLQALNSGSEITLKESISQKLLGDYRTTPKSKNEEVWKNFIQYNTHMTGHAVIQLFWCGILSHFLPLVITSTTINIQVLYKEKGN